MSEEILRPSPKNKTVSLFVTCLVDMIYPQTGVSVVEILDHLGIPMEFRAGQTCCAQPAFNAGFWDDARVVAKNFLRAFDGADLIVTPSGSCASMVRHYYPVLFKDDPVLLEKATRIASITWEFTEYLVDGLGITDLGAKLPPTKVAFHYACHGLRLMHLDSQARALAEHIEGVTVLNMNGADECCGFGGLFAVKMADVSGAMLERKLTNINAAEADVILTGDCGCIAQMNGGLSRSGEPQKVRHVADLLAEGLQKIQI
ncbi:MAG: (Fe-S)-binding protein [Anaerolineae bacterium]